MSARKMPTNRYILYKKVLLNTYTWSHCITPDSVVVLLTQPRPPPTIYAGVGCTQSSTTPCTAMTVLAGTPANIFHWQHQMGPQRAARHGCRVRGSPKHRSDQGDEAPLSYKKFTNLHNLTQLPCYRGRVPEAVVPNPGLAGVSKRLQ